MPIPADLLEKIKLLNVDPNNFFDCYAFIMKAFPETTISEYNMMYDVNMTGSNFSIQDIFNKTEASLTPLEQYALGLVCLVVSNAEKSNRKDTYKQLAVKFLKSAADSAVEKQDQLALTLGSVYFSMNMPSEGLKYFKKVAETRDYVKYLLGRYYLNGENGVRKSAEQAAFYLSSMKLSFDFMGQRLSSDGCLYQAKTIFSMEKLQSVVNSEIPGATTVLEFEIIAALRDKLIINYNKLEKTMNEIPLAKGAPVQVYFLGVKADWMHLTDEKEMWKKHQKALDTFKTDCHRDISQVIKKLDKNLSLKEWCLNLLKEIANILIYLGSFGQANKNRFFTLNHTSVAKRVIMSTAAIEEEASFTKERKYTYNPGI